MKLGSLFMLAAITTAMLPGLAQAEIYKWKDKNGTTRYSDIPPPSNIKNESIGKKTTKVPAPTEAETAQATNKAGSAAPNDAAAINREEAAAKRAQDAEAKKMADEVKAAEMKHRQESCAAARNNLRMYTAGGRMMTTDANGERRYLGDDEISNNRAEAQQAVEKFCD
jgi:hypothetical protein